MATRVDVPHIAAAPISMKVATEAALAKVAGGKLSFDVRIKPKVLR